MLRQYDEVKLNVAAAASLTTEEVEIAKYTLFSVYVPTGIHASTSHLQVVDVTEVGETPNNARDDAASLIIVAITAGETVVLPAETAALLRIKLELCSTVLGAAQVQTNAAILTLRMKG